MQDLGTFSSSLGMVATIVQRMVTALFKSIFCDRRPSSRVVTSTASMVATALIEGRSTTGAGRLGMGAFLQARRVAGFEFTSR